MCCEQSENSDPHFASGQLCSLENKKISLLSTDYTLTISIAIDNNCSEILWRDSFLLIKKLKFHNALTNYSIWAPVHKMGRNGHFKLKRVLKNFLSKKLPCKDRLPELWNCRFRDRNFPRSRRMTLLRHSCAQTENVFKTQNFFL